MGLFKAFETALTTQVGDQFKEFITCPPVENNVIIQRGVVSHGAGNAAPSQGIISNGSGIAIPDGMAMMIVDNGRIVEFSAEPGTYTYDTSSEPSIFAGDLGKSLVDSIKTIGQRITYGGQTAKDQRVYYVNIKEIPGNTFGSTQSETVSDPIYGSVEITFNGEYIVRVVDPVILVSNIIGANPKDTLTYDDIFTNDSTRANQLKGKFAQKVSEAISYIMTTYEISYGQIQKYKSDITDRMNTLLDAEFHDRYGIDVVDVNLRINLTEESREIVRKMDAKVAETARMGEVYDKNRVGTTLAATSEAMKSAAANPNGSMMGFMGMGFAQQQGANVLNSVGGMEQAPVAGGQTAGAQTAEAAQVPNSKPVQPAPGTIFGGVITPAAPAATSAETTEAPATEAPAAPAAGGFCPDCGAPKVGIFCTQCGKKLE